MALSNAERQERWRQRRAAEAAGEQQPFSAISVLTWVALGRYISTKASPAVADEVMAQHRAPSRAVEIISKAAVGSPVLGDLGDVGLPVLDWADSQRTDSAVGRMVAEGAFYTVPPYRTIEVPTPPAALSTVAEGAAKPTRRLQFTKCHITPAKVGDTFPISNLLLDQISDAGQATISRTLRAVLGNAVDAAFFAALSPTAIASSGATAINARHDLLAALSAVSRAGNSRLYWISGFNAAARASALGTSTGDAAFEDEMTPLGGTLCGLPCIVSQGVATDSLTLVDASGIAIATERVGVDISPYADYVPDDAPTMTSSGPVPATMVSAWQTNTTLFRVEASYGTQALRSGVAAQITGIAWT
jgi:hypothetical protein